MPKDPRMSSTKSNPAEYDVLSPFSRGGACDYCHSRKIRCDKHKPQCHECIKRKVTCNYGKRLKRGPKTKTKPQQNDQIQIAPRSNSHLQAMLFELEFNRKLAELWRSMLSKIGEGAVRPPPKFEPATEEFIRAQGAVEALMEDFDTTHRLIYNLHDFATSLDFASKLWQTIIEINADDLIAVISSFETSMLISMLEYIVVFQLCTKIYMLDDIAAYISKIIRCIINIVVFARDGTNDSLTPELTLKLLSSLTLTSNYFKATLDKNAIVSYHLMIQDLYEQNKSSPLFGKELEARMLCRRILSCLTKEASDMCMQRLHELDEEGIVSDNQLLHNDLRGIQMSPNLHFHLNNHLAYFGLRHQVLNEANQAIQKAEYFIKWHLDEIPQDKRPALENFYTTRLSAIHVEILLRMGHTESALQRVGQMYNAFSQLPTAFRRLCTANCNFFMVTMRHKGPFLSEEYISLLVNPTAMVNHVLFPALTQSAVKQGSNVTLECTTEAINEQIDIIESSESSPQNDTLTLDTFSWQGIDESPEATWVFTSSDQLFFDNAQLEPSDFISENNV